MLRVLLLALAGALVFLGFALPFFMPDTNGFVAGAGIVLVGALVVYLVETRTRKQLDRDTAWNQVMRTGGENLVDRGDTSFPDKD